MADTRNDVFVGSSSEFLKLRWNPERVIRDELSGYSLPDDLGKLAVNIWRDWFKEHPNFETFQILDLAAKTSEWAILIFRPDDLLRIMRKGSIQMATVRDNVLFELGLFYGYLGAQRVFILEQEVKAGNRRSHVASDIGGINRLRFSEKASFVEALKVVRETIFRRSTMFFARWAPSSSLAIGYYEQALRTFIEGRRDAGTAKGWPSFTLETLVPSDTFMRLGFSEVRQLFEGAGYEQVGSDGSLKGRPSMWVRKACQTHVKYFDIPTTLLTAQRVIESYLGTHATEDEKSRLVASEARAFCRYVRSRKIPEVIVHEFPNMEHLTNHLKAQEPKS
jgi:Predicted nucleotide-binding protein containing TIR-like domain